MIKQFHISDVLSVTTGRLVSLDGMSGIYNIMNYVLQDDLTTIGLAAMADTVRDELNKQFPQLTAIDVPEKVDGSNYKEWLKSLYAQYGEFFDVTPMHDAQEKRTLVDDINYYHELNPDGKVIL